MAGFLLIDKPEGITSHDVIDQLRRITGIRKIGHAGTLDPFATGLLIVAVEREATKRLGELLKLDKSYTATAFLGATSDTQDRTGTITDSPHHAIPNITAITKTLHTFVGEQKQIPPMYSAKKRNGKKLYELAREGKTITREPIAITIHSITLEQYNPPMLSFSVSCSSGTYIRTLAHDIGAKLKTGAYLTELRRTRIGFFQLDDAVTLQELTKTPWKKNIISPEVFFSTNANKATS